MRADVVDEFFVAPGLTCLNHASYGAVTRTVAATARVLADEVETDPLEMLGAPALAPRFRAITDLLSAELGLPADRTVLTANATAGSAALTTSLPLTNRDVVVVLDTEYASMTRGWQVRCERTGARFVKVPVTLPFTGPEQLIADLEAAADGPVSYLLISHISSSTAITFPLDEVAAWTAARGGRVLIDAAHSPGHVPVPVPGGPVAAVFANLHKWFPTMRSVGFLSLAPDLVDVVRPAEISLTWDADDLTERFAWPGTFDPTSRLSVPAAVEQHRAWAAAGRLIDCDHLADDAVDLLTGLGAIPTALPAYQPPRLRAVYLDGVTVAETKDAVLAASLRVWVGADAAGRTILRVSTHVYNDTADLDLLGSVVKGLLAR